MGKTMTLFLLDAPTSRRTCGLSLSACSVLARKHENAPKPYELGLNWGGVCVKKEGLEYGLHSKECSFTLS